MAKKPAKMANRKKGQQDGTKPLRGIAAITGDVCVGYTVVTEWDSDEPNVVDKFENMWDAINLKNAINDGTEVDYMKGA